MLGSRLPAFRDHSLRPHRCRPFRISSADLFSLLSQFYPIRISASRRSVSYISLSKPSGSSQAQP